MAFRQFTFVGLIICSLFLSVVCQAAGPLRVSKVNSRYFTDDTGRAVYLTGSHTWHNLTDMGPGDPPPKFDYEGFLDYLESHNHNFFRLWTWELVGWDTFNNSISAGRFHIVAPHPWARSGPGPALDGKPRFDLKKFDPEYFGRLRRRVQAARDRGMYVSVMLFEGWAMQFCPDAWKYHPFNPGNNINGINGDLNGDGRGFELYTLKDPALTALQEVYVKKVIDTVNEYDNVLYEISNENHPPSTQWQYHMINFIHNCEAGKPKQHPVGMTFQYRGGSNRDLFNSPAEWVSPNPEGGYNDQPPASDGRKVIISDTDHLWGIGGNRQWVWKSFLRGLSPIFMDPYDALILGEKPFNPKWERLRQAMGHTRMYAEKMDLINMTPSDLSSTGYCLANSPTEFLVYQPVSNGKFTVHTTGGTYRYEWFNVEQGKVVETGKIELKSAKESFNPPFAGDSVLYLKMCLPESTR
ncbi:MAG TPA: DUF6298 domain-containing protein [Sedimentisphaerales bacterium]|nr:DUF6298 domain-containing protein [Sedimentisphaerales bacterium]